MKQLLLLFIGALLFAQTPSSIVVNQPSPIHFGDVINFTEVYPKEAARKVGPAAHQPGTDVSCYQGSVKVFQEYPDVVSSTQNGDGTVTGVTSSITLSGFSKGYEWVSGGAQCSATLYYFTTDPAKNAYYHFLASIQFTVLD